MIGGLTPANVIFNVLNSGVVLDNNPDTINGIIMDISGMVALANNDTVNGEIISGNTISLGNNNEVEVVPTETVFEASITAYFTLGPLSLVAVMLLYRRFSRLERGVISPQRRRGREAEKNVLFNFPSSGDYPLSARLWNWIRIWLPGGYPSGCSLSSRCPPSRMK